VKANTCPCCRASTICPIKEVKAEIKQISKEYKEKMKESKSNLFNLKQSLKWFKELETKKKKSLKEHYNSYVIDMDTSSELYVYGEEKWLINCHEYITRKQEEIRDYERVYLVKSNQYPLMVRFYDDLLKEKNEILNVLSCN
jgi:5'-deoxynucleotidase YfbR-like HD superfamily hydrolase